jgi:transcription initiation factor IIE alpha subunit
MIELDLTTGLLIYLFLWLITIAILWVRELRRIKAHDWSISNNRLFRCNSCHYSFLVKDEHTNLVRCPRCNAMCILLKKQ